MGRAIAAVVSVLVLLVTGCSEGDEADDAASTTTTVPGTPAVDLTVGDCFNGLVVGSAERARVEQVVTAPCDAPHDLEVFHGFEFGSPADPYPGEDDVVELAENGCAEAFVSLLGDRASLGQVALWPTAGSWDDGDRVVLCAAYQTAGGKLRGNLP